MHSIKHFPRHPHFSTLGISIHQSIPNTHTPLKPPLDHQPMNPFSRTPPPHPRTRRKNTPHKHGIHESLILRFRIPTVLSQQLLKEANGFLGAVVSDVACNHGRPRNDVSAGNFVEKVAREVREAAFGVHVDERGGDEEVVAEPKCERLLVGLRAGAEVGECGTGLDGAWEG
ncbi:hypothetical protein V8G54_022186 [Vigna mungo]|uniref:Uncharacterized protein n=1 Tax=Vigna mungo TaxID=3915 RepID=A0AAQ3NFM5_VIGMU